MQTAAPRQRQGAGRLCRRRHPSRSRGRRYHDGNANKRRLAILCCGLIRAGDRDVDDARGIADGRLGHIRSTSLSHARDVRLQPKQSRCLRKPFTRFHLTRWCQRLTLAYTLGCPSNFFFRLHLFFVLYLFPPPPTFPLLDSSSFRNLNSIFPPSWHIQIPQSLQTC